MKNPLETRIKLLATRMSAAVVAMIGIVAMNAACGLGGARVPTAVAPTSTTLSIGLARSVLATPTPDMNHPTSAPISEDASSLTPSRATPIVTDSPSRSAAFSSTPTFGVGDFLRVAEDSFAKSFGAIAAAAAIGLVSILVVAFLCRIESWIGHVRPALRAKTVSCIDGQCADDPFLWAQTNNAFSRVGHYADLIEGRLGFRDEELRSFLDQATSIVPSGVVSQASGPAPADVGLKLSLGPIEIGSTELLWRRLSGRREFHLAVYLRPLPGKHGRTELAYVLTLDNQVWYAHSEGLTSPQVRSMVNKMASQVAWLMSRKTVHDVEALKRGIPAELRILRGYQLLSDYVQTPRSIEPLREAAEEFREAAKVESRWAFQSALLEVISLQLSQANPRECLGRMTVIQNKYQSAKKRRAVIDYNYGQAQFGLYDRTKGYDEAIRYFMRVPCPWVKLKQRLPQAWIQLLRFATIRDRFSLYCKAQCSIAITLAHQIRQEEGALDKNTELENRARRIVADVRRDLAMARRFLPTAIPEIEWRALNAEVMVALNLHRDVEWAIDRAREACRIAPHALAVKANLGSLCLLSSAPQVDAGGDPTKIPLFAEALKIFKELQRVGWDPGFVKYRLAIMRRVQGKFSTAVRLLNEASANRWRDVPPQEIAAQVQKAKRRSRSLNAEEI